MHDIRAYGIRASLPPPSLAYVRGDMCGLFQDQCLEVFESCSEASLFLDGMIVEETMHGD